MKALLPNSKARESVIEQTYFNSLELTIVAITYYLLDKKGFTAKEAQDAATYIFEFFDSMRVNDIHIAEIKAELEKDYGLAIRRKGGHLTVGLKKEENNG
jgi:hypothetical protein